jgi:hypothetical protein
VNRFVAKRKMTDARNAHLERRDDEDERHVEKHEPPRPQAAPSRLHSQTVPPAPMTESRARRALSRRPAEAPVI